MSVLALPSKKALAVRGVLSGVIAALIATLVYFWKKRKILVDRVIGFAYEQNQIYADEDQLHFRNRFASREKCNPVLSVPNFRDLAAGDAADCLAERTRVRSRQCRRLKTGVIFRSSNIHCCQEEGKLEYIRSKARRILDLRNVNEKKEDYPIAKKKFGERNIMLVALIPLQLLLSLTSIMTQIRIRFLMAFSPNSKELSKLGQMLIVQNCNAIGLRGLYLITIEYSKKTILKILKEIVRTDEPLILQCGSGKDATGLISALLLAALDVSEDDIYYTYQMSAALLSREYCENKFKNLSMGTTGLDPAFVQASPPGALTTVWDYLKREYGGAEKYLDTIGFDKKWRDALREKCLEKKV